MNKKAEWQMLLLFLRDRLLYLFFVVLIIILCLCILLLERERHGYYIELNIAYYFILLAVFVVLVWLCVDYLRQRQFYKQMTEAMDKADELQASTIIQSAVTLEQKRMSRLLEEQHRAYLNELGKYRRQQEQHNHFVLQWVHHMKTPVSVIDLLSQEALQNPASNEEQNKQFALSIQEETERLTRDLELMLYTARLDKYEIDLHIRRVPLHDLTRSVINGHKRLCIRHSIFPKIEGEAWVETDEKWITFVLNQLMSNAIKYSKSKPGTKSLQFRLHSDADGIGWIEVTDQGIGIAAHDIPRVFDPFFTGENGRSTGESTGMGLYLAKQICLRLGHTITITSALGEWTTFHISFKPSGIHLLANP